MKDVVRPLLTAMYQAANEHSIDVAVCTIDAGAYNVAQVLREEVCPFAGGPFWMLPDHLRTEAARLQGLAASGRLGVLFGAGVSLPSGLPSWGGLLQELAVKAGLDEASRAALDDLSYLDQASLIEDEFGSSQVCHLPHISRTSPAHLPHISPTSPVDEDEFGSSQAFKHAVAQCVKHGRCVRAYPTASLVMMMMRLHDCVRPACRLQVHPSTRHPRRDASPRRDHQLRPTLRTRRRQCRR